MKMKSTYIDIIRHWFPLLVATVFGLTGCSEEALVEPVSDKPVTLTLELPQMTHIVTRSYGCATNGDETNINSCMVLALDGDNILAVYENYIDFDWVYNNTIRFKKSLPKTTNRLVVICNYYNYNYSVSFSPGGTLDDYTNSLPAYDLTYGPPMVGECNVYKGMDYCYCGLSFPAAKISVAAEHNEDMSWWLCNIPDGKLFNMEEGMTQYPNYYDTLNYPNNSCYDHDAKTVSSIESVSENHDALSFEEVAYLPAHQNSIYAFTGSSWGSVNYETFHSGRTCVILKYNGKYYRIDFKGRSEYSNDGYMDFEPRRHYVIKIGNITGGGYDTPEEALNNPGSNIDYEITDGENIWSDGSSLIKFTQEFDELYYYGSNEMIDIGYLGVKLNPTIEWGYVSYPDGEISISSTSNVTLESSSILKDYFNEYDDRISTYPVRVNLNGTTGDISFTLKMKVYNLEASYPFTIHRYAERPTEEITVPWKKGVVGEGSSASDFSLKYEGNAYKFVIPESWGELIITAPEGKKKLKIKSEQ